LKNPIHIALISGLISAGIFLVVARLGLGFFFLFLPTIPLLYLGLSAQLKPQLIASFVAALLIGTLGGIDAAIIYLFLLALPACYVAWLALTSYSDPTGQKYWLPLGIPLLHITLMGCVVVALMTLKYAGDEGGIMAVIATRVQEQFAQLEGDYGTTVDKVVKHWAFLIFSMTLWLWVLAIYAHVWLASRLLAKNNKQVRANVAIEPFQMPHWLLSLLAICALASLIGSPSMQFAAKSTIVSLMLPYFLLGCALLHNTSKAWPSRRFFLFFIYFMMFALLWPAFVLSAVGFFYHIKSLSGASKSSKS